MCNAMKLHHQSIAARRPLDHWRDYPRFLWQAVLESVEGNRVFYVWMTMLTAIFLVGANAWAVQVRDGMQVTNMSDHVSWGSTSRTSPSSSASRRAA
jgi:hypothetical protein